MKFNKYNFNKRLVESGRLSWDLLIFFSKLTVFLFLMITAIIFWQNLTIELYLENQVDISFEVTKMILIVLIALILIAINHIVKNLFYKSNIIP